MSQKICMDARSEQLDVWVHDTEHILKVTERFITIPDFVVNGIVTATVNGPLEIIACIIEDGLGESDSPENLAWPPHPEWLSGGWPVDDEDTVAGEQDVRDQYSLTPLVVALANLVQFGGDKETSEVEILPQV